jgi:HAMP domain-containing protein
MAQQRHGSVTQRVLLVTAAVFTAVLLYNTAFSRQEPQTRSLIIQPSESSSRSSFNSRYVAAATANITRFKQRLLAGMVPHFTKQNYASLPGYGLNETDWQLFKPFISCPPDR